MYVLYAPDHKTLEARTPLFEEHMEPLLVALEGAAQAGRVPASLPEIGQYLQVCRWPFRRLEYAFALDVLLAHLRPGDRYLDAGSGVTPLANVFAKRGVDAHSCDYNAGLIEQLRNFQPGRIYGADVGYSAQDLTRLSFPDASFDAISCISVLEHIPAPSDQRAIAELLRVLKPGGVLALTLDYTPPSTSGSSSRSGYLARHVLSLLRHGDIAAIAAGVANRRRSREAVFAGEARHARSANQCFSVEHLEQDIGPALLGEVVPSRLPFNADLRAYTTADAKRFWDLEPGLWNNQGQRDVLPAGVVIRKASAGKVPFAVSIPATRSV